MIIYEGTSEPICPINPPPFPLFAPGMAATASQPLTANASSRSSPAVNGNTSLDYSNSHSDLPDSPGSNLTSAPPPPKKSKKKSTDPNETSKLLAAKINQLELDAMGEKEQEQEIGTWFTFLGCTHCSGRLCVQQHLWMLEDASSGHFGLSTFVAMGCMYTNVVGK